MDDVDAVQAQIARTMLTTGHWVTPRIDGVLYLEKSPLMYWLIAISYKVFGPYDWAARLPIVLSCIGLAWLTTAFGVWGLGRRAGYYAGLCMATCVGLFLFTRILIPDVMLTFTMALGMWAFLRALDEEEPHPRLWAFLLAASMGIGLLLKSLIAVVFPIGACLIYLYFTKQLFSAAAWKRLRPISGFLTAMAIAVPWHVLATLRNPPYFAWTLRSIPGQYHGFLWFYFINEQLLRFLGLRYPHDYNTVPRLYFWLFHLIWLFPWSVYFPAVCKLSFNPQDRAGRTRLLALCWIGFVLVFFTFSTTQEYYSMPVYPAMALLLGSAMAMGGDWVRRGTKALAVIALLAGVAAFAILFAVRHVPTPGDISVALSRHPKDYTLSLGHMLDLTFSSFAYLRWPLAVAGLAFLAGAVTNLWWKGQKAFVAAALMMVLFFQAARMAMVKFDPYMSSRALAEAIEHGPAGKLIVDHHYYTYSSVFFYLDESGLLLNGRIQNMVYGSAAPGSPDVFIDDAQFGRLWLTNQRYYLVGNEAAVQRLAKVVGWKMLNVVAESGGKYAMTNFPYSGTHLLVSGRPRDAADGTMHRSRIRLSSMKGES